jgi:hypothetical protein
MRPIKRSETITLNVPALSTQVKFNFPDIPQLRSDNTKEILIRGLETYHIGVMPLDFNNVAVASVAQLKASFLTLYVGDESIFRYPLVSLVAINENTAGEPSSFELDEFEDLQIDWAKSYISVPVALAPATTFDWVIRVSYEKVIPGTAMQRRLARRKAQGLPVDFQGSVDN